MGIIDKLFGKRSQSEIFADEELIKKNVCPNCWGHQEYDGKYIEYVEDQTKANINHDKQHQKAFVQQFIETNITGIRLAKDGDELACPTCTLKFKKVSAKALYKRLHERVGI